MSDVPFEPYVDDPHEPRLPARTARLRPVVVLLIIAILVATAAWRFLEVGEQDPSLDAPPVDQPDA